MDPRNSNQNMYSKLVSLLVMSTFSTLSYDMFIAFLYTVRRMPENQIPPEFLVGKFDVLL